jgi:hypothetical protein
MEKPDALHEVKARLSNLLAGVTFQALPFSS